jgi:hypothetical protein
MNFLMLSNYYIKKTKKIFLGILLLVRHIDI